MAEFINTADVIGDDEMCDQIIQRTVTEYKENRITTVGQYAFYNCNQLEVVDAPNAISIENSAFQGCVALHEVSLPNISGISGTNQFNGCTSLISADFPELVIPNHDIAASMFLNCSSLKYVNLPKAKALGMGFFDGCSSLEYGVFPEVTRLGHPSYDVSCFQNCTKLKLLDFHSQLTIAPCFKGSDALEAIILRSSQVCPLKSAPTGNANYGTPISTGKAYFYVPRALVDSYKAATNWNTIPNQIRAVEDYTVDGTVNGKLSAGVVTYDLKGFMLTNSDGFVIGSYQTTLTAYGTNASVCITMDGVDITNEVYNTETGEVIIPKVSGNIVVTASCEVSILALPTLYDLPESTDFDGTSDYIDTGIKLFDTRKDFTILIKATFDTLASARCLLHCMNENNNYPGLSIDGNSGARICYTGTSSLTTSINPASNVSALALRYVGGVLNAIRYKNANGKIVSHSIAGTPTYTAVSQNLLLGAHQQPNGTKGRFFRGTINEFKLYGIALGDFDIDTMLTLL